MIQRFQNALLVGFIVTVALSFPSSAYSASKPTFLFGNHIDTHQATWLKTKNSLPKRVWGFFYIIFTGDTDPVSGLPIARHPRGAEQDEECFVDVDCKVGWIIKALPGEAKFLFHSGVNGNDHPVWLVNRTQIPQPGSYTHFHWITSTSNDPRADTVPLECEVQRAGQLEGLAENTTCPGWFMQITAIKKFAFEHGNEVVAVTPGQDNATHLNLLTNYKEVPGITPTR